MPSLEEVAAEAAAQHAGAAVGSGEAEIGEVAAYKDFVDPATINVPEGAGAGALGREKMQLIKEGRAQGGLGAGE